MSNQPYSDLARHRLGDAALREKLDKLCRRMERIQAESSMERDSPSRIQEEAAAIGYRIVDFTPHLATYNATAVPL